MPTTAAPPVRATLRWRWYAALAVVLAVAAAYRLPGVGWGFDFATFGTTEYVELHPDEGVVCLGAMQNGVPEMKNNSLPTERGMMFQCLVLGLLFHPHDIISATRIG